MIAPHAHVIDIRYSYGMVLSFVAERTPHLHNQCFLGGAQIRGGASGWKEHRIDIAHVEVEIDIVIVWVLIDALAATRPVDVRLFHAQQIPTAYTAHPADVPVPCGVRGADAASEERESEQQSATTATTAAAEAARRARGRAHASRVRREESDECVCACVCGFLILLAACLARVCVLNVHCYQ